MIVDSLLRCVSDPKQVKVVAYGGKRRFGFRWWWHCFLLILRLRVNTVNRKSQCKIIFTDAFAASILSWAAPKSLPCLVFTHGLDLTWPNSVYQILLQKTLNKTEVVVANSANTALLLEQEFGISAPVLLPRINPPSVVSRDQVTISEPEKMSHHEWNSEDHRIVVLLGRNVTRKGFNWFVTEVLPFLDGSVRCIIAGPGTMPLSDLYMKSKNREVSSPLLSVLGDVTDHQKVQLLESADIFVQPNVPVEGDIEGFGIVVQEAALSGCFVLAADLEGLRESVFSPDIGRLLPPGDSRVWITSLNEAAQDVYLRERQSSAQQAAREFNASERVDEVIRDLFLLE